MVSISWLTNLTSELNKLIDDGYISIKQAQKLCNSGNLVEELQKKFVCEKTGFDVSILLVDYNNRIRYDINKGFAEKASFDRREYGKENGLLLLTTYAKELINEKGTDEE